MYTCDSCGEVLEEHTYAEPYGMFCTVECRTDFEVENDEMRSVREALHTEPTLVDTPKFPYTPS